MSELTVALLLTGLLALAWLANAGLDRSWTVHRYTVAMMGAGVYLTLASHDWLAAGLWLVLCANAVTRPWPVREIPRLGGLLILYAVVTVARQANLDPRDLLGSIVLAGLVHVGLWWRNHHYTWQANHTHMLWAVSLGCAVALAFLWSPWWLVAVPFLLWPWIRRPGQAHLWLAATGIAVLAQWSLLGALLLALAGSIALAWLAWPSRLRADGPDHGRLRIWSIFLVLWWKAGWRTRLLGNGFNSWVSYADSFSQMLDQKHPAQRSHNEFFVNPHNEYVLMIFEHGIAGFMLLLAYLVSLLWGAWQTHPALIIPAVACCATAATSFPWTLPTEICVRKGQAVDYVPFGCMGMVMVTTILIIALGG